MALGEFNHRAKWIAAWIILGCLLFAVSEVRSADRLLRSKDPDTNGVEKETGEGFAMKLLHFFWQSGKSSYQPVWPDMAFGWRLVLGSVVGFFGAALGSVGGVGGGGIFVPMLTLIIGFDPKSSTGRTKHC